MRNMTASAKQSKSSAADTHSVIQTHTKYSVRLLKNQFHSFHL